MVVGLVEALTVRYWTTCPKAVDSLFLLPLFLLNFILSILTPVYFMLLIVFSDDYWVTTLVFTITNIAYACVLISGKKEAAMIYMYTILVSAPCTLIMLVAALLKTII